MKKLIFAFITGMILTLVITVILSLGYGVYGDANRLPSQHFHFFGKTILQYNLLEPKGHMLNFGYGLLIISVLAGTVNAGLYYLFNRPGAPKIKPRTIK
ncbi:hypothetical protein E2R51_09050 [Jeotgalibacillus sp. S-D1]|uniref:hypothetical protein n=1 Tax=Jeotgalibacillus sp. S-D1 TaxID=2552189 RepID=UPI0010594161|nr:hypothetical protein [Jeotgalibacillus sp. S-D1]TDL32807.1 hypothetical protein E2R51_09050 [Jeotgalibacillus sp. S-D1]